MVSCCCCCELFVLPTDCDAGLGDGWGTVAGAGLIDEDVGGCAFGDIILLAFRDLRPLPV